MTPALNQRLRSIEEVLSERNGDLRMWLERIRDRAAPHRDTSDLARLVWSQANAALRGARP